MSSPETESLSTKIDGFTTVVFRTQISEYSNPYKDGLKANKSLWPSPLLTTDELIYYLNQSNHTANATGLIESLVETLLPEYVGVNYTVDGNTLYLRHQNKKNDSQTVISNKKITYNLINASSQLNNPVKSEVILWQ